MGGQVTLAPFLTPSHSGLLRPSLETRVLDRSTYQRREIGYPELESWVGARIDDYERVYLGASSVTIPELKLKMVVYDEFPVTAGELAREYLRLVYDDYDPGLRPGHRHPGWGWEAPLYCAPTRHRPMAYIDIHSAYWQLVRCFRPDDLPLPDGGCIEGELAWLSPEAVEEDRRLRHALVGSMFANKVEWHRYGKPMSTYAPNKWSNPSLKRLCMSTLHAVAAACRRRFGLHAFLTDAMIVDADQGERVVKWLADEWSLSSRIEAVGMGQVWSTTQYMVGGKQTMDFTNGNADPRTAVSIPSSNLRRVSGEILRQQRMERVSR